MESSQSNMSRVMAEELLSRFRSKEDLYRYMVQQSKIAFMILPLEIVGLYLPSMDGTKIAFIKAILCDEKKAFKAQEI